MSSKQRLEVWNGARKKTSGGLQKKDLIKNKRGRVVSKKKSEQAADKNNLGSWLRQKGKKVEKTDMLRKKADPPADAPISKRPKKPKKSKGKKEVPKAAPKSKPAPKAAPKPAPVKQPKKQPKIVRKQAQAAPKRKNKSNINPITQQPYEKKGGRFGKGFVEKGKVSLDNMRLSRLRRKKAPKHVFGGW